MSNYLPFAIAAGIGVVLVAMSTYALSGGKNTTSSLKSATEFPLSISSDYSTGYINPVAPTQKPPQDMPYPKNLATSLVTNVGGKRRTKRKQSRKKRLKSRRGKY